jgi:hypothetical protein
MRYILTVCTLSSALVMVAAHRTAAQQDVPRELALALIPFGATEGGEIIVGQMPPDLAAAFTLPPGARVLGSFVSLAYAQAVLTIPGKTDSALALARRTLSEHGWVARNPMSTGMGGLQFISGGSGPSIFCKPGEPAGLNISAQFHGPSTTLLHLTRNAGSTSCDETRSDSRQAMAMRMQDFPLATVPPLWSPGDFRTSSQRCRRTQAMNDQAQDQPLLTELSPAEVLAHYGRQLDSAGWKPATTEGESVSKTWSKMIPSRGTQEVTITVTRMPTQTGCYDVNLRATGLAR